MWLIFSIILPLDTWKLAHIDEVWIFCELGAWSASCLCHYNTVCNISTYSTMLCWNGARLYYAEILCVRVHNSSLFCERGCEIMSSSKGEWVYKWCESISWGIMGFEVHKNTDWQLFQWIDLPKTQFPLPKGMVSLSMEQLDLQRFDTVYSQIFDSLSGASDVFHFQRKSYYMTTLSHVFIEIEAKYLNTVCKYLFSLKFSTAVV